MSSSEDEILLLCALSRQRRRRHRRRWYVRPLNDDRRRTGEFHSLVTDMRLLQDTEVHHMYFRMDSAAFDKLLEKVTPLISHKSTHRDPVSPRERLCATLRFLASGSSQQSIAQSYRLGKSTISGVIYETCQAIWSSLKAEFVAAPTREQWIEVAASNWSLWNFPMCLGAIDGKHVAIKAPPRAGSDFFNYKKYNSVVLLAVADSKYRFLIVDIGAFGRESDGGVFSRSEFGKSLECKTSGIPESGCLPGTNINVPYVFIGDEAFPLKPYLMRPFPGVKSLCFIICLLLFFSSFAASLS